MLAPTFDDSAIFVSLIELVIAQDTMKLVELCERERLDEIRPSQHQVSVSSGIHSLEIPEFVERSIWTTCSRQNIIRGSRKNDANGAQFEVLQDASIVAVDGAEVRSKKHSVRYQL